ncbi:alpha/beta fold hydrolase [Virgibacillus doumboii]|uniref:alpha/beta fold hydrolase n=1 Tax=Virgibacillus doumboii TaxID=2697503 RepID=UPI001966D768|nr:alpha/beta hydrolase [Virgibacillus doumboii]
MNNVLYDYYVEKTGNGKPVIFLPGGGFSGNEGLNIAVYLQNDYETHMMDLPGLGKGMGIQANRITSLEMAKWLKEYLDQKQIDKANLIGHSLGGAVLLAFTFHFPDRVNKLVLLDQGHKPFSRIPKSEFGVFAYAFPVLNFFTMIFGKPALNLLSPLFSGDQNNTDFELEVQRFCKMVSIEDSEYVRKALHNQTAVSTDGLNLMFGFYNLNLPEMLKGVKVPTYLAYATFDGVNEGEQASTHKHINKLQQHKQLPISYRAVDGGHYVHWSDPSLLGDIRLFFQGE